MMALVGFLDILGTKNKVINERFSDYEMLDFTGAAGLAAKYFPLTRIAVFSDSIIISSENGNEIDFLKAISYMYGQWFADFIQVRGGIALSDIRWIEYDPADNIFAPLKNFVCSRVYGSGLVQAYELENRSGPGAITFLTEEAAEKLKTVSKNSVLEGITPMLCWADENEAKTLLGYSKINVEYNQTMNAERRHALATQFYWQHVNDQRKYQLSDN
jgi:hypothetical protein